jgi:hypothetical protein
MEKVVGALLSSTTNDDRAFFVLGHQMRQRFTLYTPAFLTDGHARGFGLSLKPCRPLNACRARCSTSSRSAKCRAERLPLKPSEVECMVAAGSIHSFPSLHRHHAQDCTAVWTFAGSLCISDFILWPIIDNMLQPGGSRRCLVMCCFWHSTDAWTWN